jgi:putative phage-type endonuclease
MPIINLEQGSDDWLAYRRKRIMATDTPIILGSNPWHTKLKLWEEKLELIPPKEINDVMKEGQLKEPIARALAIKKLGINFLPIVYESDINPWMASSLDGISYCGKYILELKCPSKPKLYEQICNGFIPEYYEDQMQHQLTTLPKVELVIYGVYFKENNSESLMFLERTLNPKKQAEIIAKGQEFYINLCTMNPPTEWKLKERK